MAEVGAERVALRAVGMADVRARVVSFKAVGIAAARARRASNIEMNRPRIVGEWLVEGLVRIAEESDGCEEVHEKSASWVF